jgi:hypothetical protein
MRTAGGVLAVAYFGCWEMMLFCNEFDEEKWSGDAPGQDRENRREKEDGGSLVATKSSGDARRLAEVRRGIPLICDVLRE